MLFALVAFLAGVLATLRLGRPSIGRVLAATAAWVLFALPDESCGGESAFADDALSRESGAHFATTRIAGQRAGEHADPGLCHGMSALLVLELCTYFDKRWLAAPCLLVLAVVSLAVWMRVLSKCGFPGESQPRKPDRNAGEDGIGHVLRGRSRDAEAIICVLGALKSNGCAVLPWKLNFIE